MAAIPRFINILIYIVLALPLSLTFGCQRSSDDAAAEAVTDANSNNAESAMSEAGSQSTASEGASTPALMELDPLQAEFQEYAADLANPADIDIHPQAACAFSTVRSACSSNVATIVWGSCTIGTVTMTGGWTETYSSSAVCTAGNLATASNGDYVDRSSSSQVATFLSGITLTTDTSGGTAYDNSIIPAGAIRITKGVANRTIAGFPTGAGVHKVLKGPRGTTWYDYYVQPSLTVAGTRALGTRTITGTTTIKHNRATYTAAHTFNSVTWGSSTCCYPTSGSISSVFTGSVTGSTTMTFTTSCGSATFVDTDASSSTVTLTKCN